MASSMFGGNTFVAGGTFQQQVHQYNVAAHLKGPFEFLQAAASPGAFHNSADRRDPPKCHPNTRVAVLQKIKDWILGDVPEWCNALIAWLHGPAGSGKSAIAQSIAEWCCEQGILVASYFFSRFDSTRNHSRSLVATIAYQASLCLPQIKEDLITVIGHDPLIFDRSMDTQIVALVVQPLRKLQEAGYFHDPKSPRVIIIDGLDECDDREGQIEILETISKAMQRHHLPLIFLIASRPEYEISTAFGMEMNEISVRIPLDDEYLPFDDIRLFLRDKFNKIKQNHPLKIRIPATWPSDDDIEELVSRSSGQFIYASTVVKFVQSIRHRPIERLEIVRGIRPPLSDMPFAELDALYIQILSSLQDPEPVLQVLAFQLLERTENVDRYFSDIGEVLFVDEEDLRLLLCDLGSLVSVEFKKYSSDRYDRSAPEITGSFIHFFHASLEDFLVDRSRSNQFYLDLSMRSAEFAHISIRRLIELQEEHLHFYLSLMRLPFRIRQAAPTDELRNDILEASFVKSPWADEPDYYPKYLMEILESIKDSKFEDADQLYNHQRQLLFNHLAKAMEMVYSDSGLTALLAVGRFLEQESLPVDYLETHLFGVKTPLSGVHPLLHQLGFTQRHDQDSSHLYDTVLDYLENPSLSGVYALNEDRYAGAAVYFLRHLYGNHLQSKIKSLDTPQRRRNTPWRWRQQRRHKAFLREALSQCPMRSIWPSPILSRNPNGPDSKILRISFRFSMTALLYVLPKSGRSEELIDVAVGHTFGPLFLRYPRLTRSVKAEVAKYLARMEVGNFY